MGNSRYCIAFWLFCALNTWLAVTALDECTIGLHTCVENAVCSDADLSQNGTATCACKTGYSGDGTHCQDINECLSGDPCAGANAVCENIGGSFKCLCGPKLIMVNGICVDVDECASNTTHSCDQNAKCTNLNGGYNCTCNPGYKGDGNSCTDIDECNESSHNCHLSTLCKNSPGSYTCTCRVNVQIGKSCQASSYCPQASDVDECSNGSHDCHKDAVCTNIPGSYVCICKSGFTGNGKKCSENNDDDNDKTVIILVSIAIGLLALCLIGIIIVTIYICRRK